MNIWNRLYPILLLVIIIGITACSGGSKSKSTGGSSPPVFGNFDVQLSENTFAYHSSP